MLKKSLFFLLLLFCISMTQLWSEESHTSVEDENPIWDEEGRISIPETSESAKKINDVLRPFSFGVGTEPGIDKNSLYIFLTYDYSDKYSSLYRVKYEGCTDKEDDLEIENIAAMTESKYFQVNKKKTIELDLIPFIKKYSYCDLGFGLYMEYYKIETEGVWNSNGVGSYIDSESKAFYLGPMIYLRFQVPVCKYVNFGGNTEIIPVTWLTMNNENKMTTYYTAGTEVTNNEIRKYGLMTPYIYQNLYLTFFKYINLSTSFSYTHYHVGERTKYLGDDLVWRYGAAILRKPHGCFLNFLGGVFYEQEWNYLSIDGSRSHDKDGRWIICIGASS